MMRSVILALALLVAGREAAAMDYVLVKWAKTDRCEIITTVPVFGNHWIELAVFQTRWEAERELERILEQGRCRPPRRRSIYDPYGGDGPGR